MNKNAHAKATDAVPADLTFIQDSLDAMSQGLSVVRMVDGTLMMVLSNRRFGELLNFPDWLCSGNRPFEDFIRYNAERGEYGPGDPEEQIQSRVQLAEKFEAHSFQRTRPDGTVIEIVGKPLSTSDGFVTTYTDVTEREAAQHSSDLLMQALDGTVVGIAIFDTDDRLVFTNAQLRNKNASAPASAAPGISFEKFLHNLIDANLIAGIAGREEEWIRRRIAQHKKPTGTLEVERQDGEWMLIEDVHLASGHTVIVSTDITELKKSQMAVVAAKEEAEFANRAKTEFLANMSHELRTPLNSVIGFSELLIASDMDLLSDDKIGDYLNDINRSGRHLLRLISDILDISKIEVGELVLDEEDIEPRSIVVECLRMIEERARRSGIVLKPPLSSPGVKLHADATRLKQIILNLTTNAIKFTPVGGTVNIDWINHRDGSLTLEVSDNGTGMTSENLSVALETFGQVASSMTRDHEGAGLGLPLSRRLAELHGAQLEIESSIGAGTTVRVAFPPERIIKA